MHEEGLRKEINMGLKKGLELDAKERTSQETMGTGSVTVTVI